MNSQPTIDTARLILRPFTLADANDVRILAGDRAIADTTQTIPHPYELGMAEEWIASHQPSFTNSKQVVFAITLRETSELVGAIDLRLDRQHSRAELGYWVGKPYWGQGYCTEAATAILQFGFGILGFHRIFAHHLTRNPASGRVMAKIGMRHEGTLIQHANKWGVYEDVEIWGKVAETPKDRI